MLEVSRSVARLGLRTAILLGVALLGGGYARSVEAQASASGYCSSNVDGLCAPAVFDLFNPLERTAAAANQQTYDTLEPICEQRDPAQCTDRVFSVYQEVRALVQNANVLAGNLAAPSEFSLDLDQQGLGFALRWTAAEEMAAQGSMTTEFAANQVATLAARIATMRRGLSGLRTAAGSRQPGDVLVASGAGAQGGGGASADEETIAGRLGWYIDGAYGYGDREDTTFIDGYEDAFDFDGQEVTVGVDYRFTPSIVVGLALGYTDQEVDFDSSQSIVDGDINADGISGQVYLLAEGEHAYLSGSLGYQTMTFDTRRRIAYPSLNPNVPGTDDTALSSADSSSFVAAFGGGYQFRAGGFAAEPYLDANYLDASVDGFTERSFPTGNPGAQDDSQALRIGEQSIESLDVALGLRLQYVFVPSFGVLIPYVRAAYHSEFLNDSRTILATYESVYSEGPAIDGPSFLVPIDEPDDSYYTVTGGFSVVLKGGLQGFLQYLEVLDLEYYSESVISGGLRYEF